MVGACRGFWLRCWSENPWIYWTSFLLCNICFFLSCVCNALCARLFIYALWSPTWKGLGFFLWSLIVNLSLIHWYPGSGVVLDCIDSWSLHKGVIPLLPWTPILKDIFLFSLFTMSSTKSKNSNILNLSPRCAILLSQRAIFSSASLKIVVGPLTLYKSTSPDLRLFKKNMIIRFPQLPFLARLTSLNLH